MKANLGNGMRSNLVLYKSVITTNQEDEVAFSRMPVFERGGIFYSRNIIRSENGSERSLQQPE